MYLNLKYCTLTMTKNTLLESNSTLNIRGEKKKAKQTFRNLLSCACSYSCWL